MKNGVLLWMSLLLLLSGCATRSISNSGYSSRGWHGGNAFYNGELSEFDVLGVHAGKDVSEESIQQALQKDVEPVRMEAGTPILLIQSGALIPDEAMVKHLENTFNVSIFGGIPEKEKAESESYAKSLRLAAAKGGIQSMIVYWGTLESGSVDHVTKTVSWVPIVGRVLPDETQHMRIRLKVAVVDVATGRWDMFTPETFDDKALSARLSRRSADQSQVLVLKAKAYEAAAKEVVARYVQ